MNSFPKSGGVRFKLNHHIQTAILFCFIFYTTLIRTSNVTAHRNDIKFERITIEQGLSQSSVRCILQDRRGFMWIGTEDGLNKYDGYTFKVYKPDPDDPFSISSNYNRSICEDQAGVLWIGTNGGGLNKFDHAANHFIRFQHDPNNPNTLSNNYVWSIHEDEAGILWLGTDGGGLNRFDPRNETFTHYRHDPDDPNSLSDDGVLVVYEDRTGVLWIGTRNGGLNKFDRRTERFTRYKYDPNDPSSLGSNFVRAVYEDQNGILWVGTDGGGLNRFDSERGVFTHYRHDPNDLHSLSDDRVWALYEDRSGVLWIGTDGGGLNRFDPELGQFIHYRNDSDNTNSLSNDHVYSIYEDRLGVLWFGTEIGGVNKLDRDKEKFVHYQANPGDPNSLNNNHVWSIYEDNSGILWIGTRTGGLNKFDRRKKQFVHYLTDSDNPNSLSSDHIRAIYEAPSEPGVLWLGTDHGGLNKFIPEKEQFIRYLYDTADPYSLSGNRVYSILEDRSGILWVGTRTGGLNAFDRMHERFTHYRHDPGDSNSLSNDFVYKILEDRSGVLWIGTFAGGLNKFDREHKRFIRYRSNINDPGSLSSDCVLCIYEDKSGVLWIGTGGGGLNKFDRINERFIRYDIEEGLPNEVVYGILEDDQGNLWISTNHGLARFNQHTETFKNYTKKDGLQSNEFNGGSYCRSRSGEMFFGGINGINAFFPESIRDNPHIPPVVITSFQKLNQETEFDRPISELRELKLSHKDYVFSFEFAALDYTAPAKNLYAYKMEGLDEDWIYTDASKRFANYTTLPPGKYTFRVKGSNNDGVWNEEGASINITITPPLWKTWWFRTVTALVVCALAIALYVRRLRNVRMKIEINAARDVQLSIMPQSDPQIDGFDISGICIPANEIGGDFYDYVWLNGEKTKFGIFVGDVCGKAMKAAMIAVMSSGMIYSKVDDTDSTKDIMTRLNRSVHLKTDDMMFTSLCLASLDTQTREFTYTIAGINEPLLKSNGAVVSLEGVGRCLPLGIVDDNAYEERKVPLQANDVLVLFTDGIPDARNNSKEFYGEKTLQGLLDRMETSTLSAKEIKERIITDVKHFYGNAPQHDDMTIIVVKSV